MSPDFQQVYAELSAEHEEVMALVDRLAGHQSLVGLAPMLEELHGLLIRHFSHEQFPGGLYECMGAYGSDHHEDLKVLVEDHCIILSGVRGLLERIRVADDGQQAPLLTEVASIVGRLRDHEHREHALAEKLMAE